MVILHVKRNAHEFLFETTTSIAVSELVRQLSDLHNARLKVLRLSAALRALAAHGPLRPEETRGLSKEVAKLSELDSDSYGMPTNPDEYAQRTGVPPAAEIAAVLNRTADAAISAVDVKLVNLRKNLEISTIKEHLDCLRGAVMIAYPAYHRLPIYDPARIELEGTDVSAGGGEFEDILDSTDCSLWWAGKELSGGIFGEWTGKNEKTKVIIKLQNKSAGAPVREPRIDEETHKAMLAFYYKKQEEAKKLKNDDDDSYLASQWADPKGLKGALITGGKDISWKMA